MFLEDNETAKLVAVCTDDKVRISMNANVGDFLHILKAAIENIMDEIDDEKNKITFGFLAKQTVYNAVEEALDKNKVGETE